MATSAPAKFRIDVDIHNLLMNSGSAGPGRGQRHRITRTRFPPTSRIAERSRPRNGPRKRDWTHQQVWRKVRGWLLPYIRSRVMPGEFHPMTAYLFLDYKCNLDCWQWSPASPRSRRPPRRCRRRGLQFCSRCLGRKAEPPQSLCPEPEEPRASHSQAVRLRLHGVLQYQHLPQQP
jgi:hypothetical protein